MDIFHDSGIRGITRRTVCIVRFGKRLWHPDPKPGVFYQVTVDPQEISGNFIRFGGQGDEITGWQFIDFMRLCHVIAVADDEGQLKTVTHDESIALIDGFGADRELP